MAVVIGADITTDGSSLERQLRRDKATIERTLGGAFKTVGTLAALPFKTVSRLTRATTGLVGKLTSINNIVRGTALVVVGRRLFQSLDHTIASTGSLLVQTKALANQTGKTQRQVEDYISSINNASAGLLDFKVAAELANRALLLGVPQKSIADLIKYVSLIATASGEADRAESQIKTLLQAIATGRTQSLLAFGVQLDLSEFEGLGPQERQLGIFQEALSQLEAKARSLGVSGKELFFTYTGIFGNIKDIKNELGKSVIESEAVRAVIKQIADLTGGIAQSLRDFGFEDTIGPLFEKLLQIGGAFAADLGNAIAVGILRGLDSGLAMIGFSLGDMFTDPETIKQIDEFMGRKVDPETGRVTYDDRIDFGKTKQRLGELGKAFPTRSGGVAVLDPENDKLEYAAAQKRLADINLAQIDKDSQAWRNAVKRTREDTGLRGPELRDETYNWLEAEGKRLRTQLGFGDPRYDKNAKTPQGEVSASTGTDAGDSLGQRIGKSIVSGVLTGQEKLIKKFVDAFDESVINGLVKVAGSLIAGGLKLVGIIFDGVTGLVDAIGEIDWMSIGELIGRGIINAGKGAAGNFVSAAGDAVDAVAGKIETSDTKLGEISRSWGDFVTQLQETLDPIRWANEADFRDKQKRLMKEREEDSDITEPLSDATNAVQQISTILDRFTSELA